MQNLLRIRSVWSSCILHMTSSWTVAECANCKHCKQGSLEALVIQGLSPKCPVQVPLPAANCCTATNACEREASASTAALCMLWHRDTDRKATKLTKSPWQSSTEGCERQAGTRQVKTAVASKNLKRNKADSLNERGVPRFGSALSRKEFEPWSRHHRSTPTTSRQ